MDEKETLGERPAQPGSDGPASDAEGESDCYVPVQVSSDTTEEHQDDHSEGGVHVDQSDQSICDKFERFMKNKHQVRIEIDIERIDLLPPQLRQPITNIVTKISRWDARGPSGPALVALPDLADRLNGFLELQLRREDRDYELRCRDLLKLISQNTLKTQKVTRELKDAAIPRALDEYK
jgi:hypothetical protein